jgi:hypothetical protein
MTLFTVSSKRKENLSETVIAYLVISLVACVASFFFGYFFCKSRGKGLAGNSDLCDRLTDTIKDSSERADSIEGKLGNVIETGRDIEEILRKYSAATTESKDLE